MTLCLSQGFVFSAHIALNPIVCWWLCVGLDLSERPLQRHTQAPVCWHLMLALSRSGWDGFTEEHAIPLVQICKVTERVCVCICLVHQVAHPSFGEQCLFTSTLIVLLLLCYFLPLLSWFLGHLPWSILHIQYILFFPWLFCIRLTNSFAFHLSIILWVALQKYLFIHLGKRKYISSFIIHNVCTLKGCSSTPVCIILFCNISVWWVTDKPADNTSLPQHTAPSCQVRLCWQNTAASHGHRRTRFTSKIPARIMKYSSNWNEIWNVET